jgi:four helix bundle protein
MGDYRKLKIWQESHRIVLEVYRLTSSFPRVEIYGIISQLRRAAGSVPANIAEGAGRNSRRDFARFCRNSLGSANELDYHLLLSRDLGYLPDSEYHRLASDVVRLRGMISRFVQKLLGSTDSQ